LSNPDNLVFRAAPPIEELLIQDPELVIKVMHEKKQIILNLLFEEALTIQDIKKQTKINPGTIKRHLDDLLEHNLVYVEYIEQNAYNILMKYYRAKAKKFIINFVLPEKP
jgi:predicted transcriptional regulator